MDVSRNSYAHLDPNGWLCDFDTVKELFHDNFNSVSMPEYTADGMVKVLLSEIGIADVEIDEIRDNTPRNFKASRRSFPRRIYGRYIAGTIVGAKLRELRSKFRKNKILSTGKRYL